MTVFRHCERERTTCAELHCKEFTLPRNRLESELSQLLGESVTFGHVTSVAIVQFTHKIVELMLMSQAHQSTTWLVVPVLSW